MRPPPISKRAPKFCQWQPHIWNLSGAPVMIKQSVNSAFVISRIIYKKRLELSWRLVWSLYLLYLLRFQIIQKRGRIGTFWFGSIRFRLLPFDFECLDCYWPASHWLPALFTDLLATGFPHWSRWFDSDFLLMRFFVCLEIISSAVNAASRQTW